MACDISAVHPITKKKLWLLDELKSLVTLHESKELHTTFLEPALLY